MRKRDAVTFIFLLAALAAACQRPRVSDTSGPPPSEGTVELEHRFEGQLRTYRLHIPERAQEPYPLLVSLHGLGATARDQELLTGSSLLADQEGFAVVYPQGQPAGGLPAWTVLPESVDVRYVSDLVVDLSQRYPIDQGRIYVAGISNGGGMANRLGATAPIRSTPTS